MRGPVHITRPKLGNSELAYLCGFICGDGHLCWRPIKGEYRVICTGNLNDEQKFYKEVLGPLFKRLFDIEPHHKSHIRDNTCNLVVYSKELVQFLNQQIGIPIGAKSAKIIIPTVFLCSKELTASFIRGFADADFCITLKRRYRDKPYYPAVCGSSKSKEMLIGIAEFLRKLGFSVVLQTDLIKHDPRFKSGKIVMNQIDINGHMQLVKWMQEIGSLHPKMQRRYENWMIANKTNKRAAEALKMVAGVRPSGSEPF